MQLILSEGSNSRPHYRSKGSSQIMDIEMRYSKLILLEKKSFPPLAYMEVSLSSIDPSYHDIRGRHLSIGRQSKSNPSSSAHIHCKINGLCLPGEVPVQSIVLVVLIIQNKAEWVGLEINRCSCSKRYC